MSMNYAVRAERRDALAIKLVALSHCRRFRWPLPCIVTKMLKLERFSCRSTDRLAQDFLYLPISPELKR